MTLASHERQALVRAYVCLALGALGALRLFLGGIGADPLVVGLTAALLGVALIPGRAG